MGYNFDKWLFYVKDSGYNHRSSHSITSIYRTVMSAIDCMYFISMQTFERLGCLHKGDNYLLTSGHRYHGIWQLKKKWFTSCSGFWFYWL